MSSIQIAGIMGDFHWGSIFCSLCLRFWEERSTVGLDKAKSVKKSQCPHSKVIQVMIHLFCLLLMEFSGPMPFFLGLRGHREYRMFNTKSRESRKTWMSWLPYSTKSAYAKGNLKFRIAEAKIWMLWAGYNLSHEKGVGWHDGFELITPSLDDILSSNMH